jgi:hypothetical protein
MGGRVVSLSVDIRDASRNVRVDETAIRQAGANRQELMSAEELISGEF